MSGCANYSGFCKVLTDWTITSLSLTLRLIFLLNILDGWWVVQGIRAESRLGSNHFYLFRYKSPLLKTPSLGFLLWPSSHHSRVPYSLVHFRALIRFLIPKISPNILDWFHLGYSSGCSSNSYLIHSKFVISRNLTWVRISTNLLGSQLRILRILILWCYLLTSILLAMILQDSPYYHKNFIKSFSSNNFSYWEN